MTRVNTIKSNAAIGSEIAAIAEWHHDRNLVNGATNKDQFCKLVEEVGELANSINKNKPVIDDIGDIIVVLINIMEREGLTMSECLIHAYDEIKDRKGKMVNGSFVKEGDL